MTMRGGQDNSVDDGQLRTIVERLERMHEERRAIAGDIKEIYAEAKGNGFDTKALKIVIRHREQDASERLELEAVVELYLTALGMADAPREDNDHQHRAPAPARTREIIEEFPADEADDQSTAARKDVPNQNADGHGAVNATEAGTQAPPVDTNILSFEAGPIRPYCLNPGTSCGGMGRKHCFPCEQAHANALAEIPHHGTVKS